MNWLRSSACTDNACLEVAFDGDVVRIRTGIGNGMVATPAEWDAFLAGVKNGEFDRDPD